MKICIQNSTLSCEETVKLLGIEIDYQLNFDIHISSICRKASPLSCTFSNFFEFLSVRKCQAKGQKLKLLRMKEWNIVNLLNLSKYRPKRLSIFSCCDAFLLESESNVLINWFKVNKMQANPDTCGWEEDFLTKT
jgi:hypothetical protein